MQTREDSAFACGRPIGYTTAATSKEFKILSGATLHVRRSWARSPSVNTFVVLGDEQQLWPREDVIEVVLHLVVLRQTPQVGRLHL